MPSRQEFAASACHEVKILGPIAITTLLNLASFQCIARSKPWCIVASHCIFALMFSDCYRLLIFLSHWKSSNTVPSLYPIQPMKTYSIRCTSSALGLPLRISLKLHTKPRELPWPEFQLFPQRRKCQLSNQRLPFWPWVWVAETEDHCPEILNPQLAKHLTQYFCQGLPLGHDPNKP